MSVEYIYWRYEKIFIDYLKEESKLYHVPCYRAAKQPSSASLWYNGTLEEFIKQVIDERKVLAPIKSTLGSLDLFLSRGLPHIIVEDGVVIDIYVVLTTTPLSVVTTWGKELHKFYNLPIVITRSWLEVNFNTYEGTNFSLSCLSRDMIVINNNNNQQPTSPETLNIHELYNLL